MSLKAYKQKREFKKTPEPSVYTRNYREAKNKKSESGREQEGKIKSSKKNIYMIHKHNASHLHWDLRLEMKGTLKSWAIPKQPPKRKGLKRLAVQVEDHPLEYAKFEGTIPEGNYGAGKVEIWDKGKYELLEKKKDLIVVDIKGKVLKGEYCLVRTKFQGKKKNWIFFKK